MKWVLILAILSGLGLVFYPSVRQSFLTGHKESLVFVVEEGKSWSGVSYELWQKGVVRSPTLLRFYLKAKGLSGCLKKGEYQIESGTSIGQMVDLLCSGNSIAYRVTFPEGANVFEFIEILESKGFRDSKEFRRLAFDPNFVYKKTGFKLSSLEGFLFPSTYSFTRFTRASELIERMVSETKKNLKLARAPSHLTELEAIILASLVEKETGAPFERKTISGVFHNRLRRKMRLQTDPTVLYGKWLLNPESRELRITAKDLKTKTDYNTYKIPGLPPGPIANPGFEAMKAAFSPETHDLYYFVSRNDGTHVFSRTYEEHAKYVNKFQKNRSAREGRSWRDLNSKM